MKDSVVYLLYKLLRKDKISIDKEEIKFQLLSHPTYPSLHSITGVLDHFNIENVAAKIPIDLETISQLDTYFLTQIRNDTGEHFVIFVRNKGKINLVFSKEYTQVLSPAEFLEIWTGVILIVNPEGELIQEATDSKKTRLIPIGISGTILVFIASLVILRPTPMMLFHFLLSGIGLTISIFIILKELGLQSNTINRFCSLGSDKMNCDTVLNSSGAWIFKAIKLSDLGILYFCSLIFYSFLTLLQRGNFNNLYYLSVLAIPFTIYAIFYQIRIIKSWCTLCLGVVVTLWFQAIIALTHISANKHFAFHPLSILLLLFSFLIMALLWSYILPLLKHKIELRSLKIDHYRFKRNYTIFDTLLSKSTPLPVGVIDSNEIVFGITTDRPKLSITIITNPSCGHCKEVHTLVEKLLHLNTNQIQIIIRFNVSVQPDNDTTKIAFRLIELYHTQGKEKCLEAMQDIYVHLEPNKWIEKWGVCTDIKYLKTIEKQSKWCEAHHKNFTPEILIEGLAFPKEYKREDLIYFIENLLEKETI